MDRSPKTRVLNTLVKRFLLGFLPGAVVAATLLVAVPPPAQAFHFPWDQGHDTTDWNDPEEPGPCEDGRCDPCSGTGSPVYVSTGHFIWSETDVAFPGRPKLDLQRTYNSHDPRSGIFGNGWSVGCDVRLVRVISDATPPASDTQFDRLDYILIASNGKRYVYEGQASNAVPLPVGPFKTPPGRFDRVEPQGDGTVRLVAQDGSFRAFNAQGRLIAEVDRNGNRLDYSYDASDRLVRIADTNGRFLVLTYNAAGRVATLGDHASRSWSYGYDLEGNLVAVTDPAGGVRSYQYQSFSATGDGHTYQHLVQVTDAAGVVETSVTYSGSRVASYTEGSNRFRYSYNTSTRTVTKTDALGNRVTYRYDDAGQVTAITDPLGHTRTIAYDNGGRIVAVTDRTGETTTAGYDEQGRRLSLTNPLGETTTYEYQGNNPLPSKITSPSGRVTTMGFDAFFNPVQVTDPAGAITRLTYNAQGDMTSRTDALGNTTSFAPTPSGLLGSITDPLGRQTTLAHDAAGNRTLITNAAGETRRLAYDLLDRVISLTDGLGNTTNFDYDAAGRLTRVTDAAGRSTSFAYDSFGRLRSRIQPSGRQISVAYRADNRLSSLTLQDGTGITRSYDAVGRLIRESAGGLVTTFGYNARGDVTSASNEVGTVLRSFDAAGRLLSETTSGQSVVSAFNAEGERLNFTAFGETTEYLRDVRGFITSINGPSGRFNLSYDDLGRVVSLARPNGAATDYTYDPAGQLTRIAHSGGFSADYEYVFDAAGRIATWAGAGPTWNYSYDVAGRLTAATQGPESFTYAYDAVGNRLSNGGVFDLDNRLTENASYSFSYDNRGQLLEKTDKATGSRVEYTWNARGRLVQVEQFPSPTSASPATVLAYAYGPLGRRWERGSDGATRRYVYDGFDQIGELDGSSSVPGTIFTYGPGIDNPLGATGDIDAFYYRNHQGSIMALADSVGAILTEYDYTPFGISSASNATANRFRYTAREFETQELNYHRARYYDPTVGRWLSPDPIGFSGGDTNLYAYVGNDPVNFVDPSGEIADTALDLGFLAYDLYRLFKDNVFGDCGNLGPNLGALGADLAGVFIPGVTGLGAGTRAASKADDVIQGAMARGRASETRVLNELGLPKNTQKVTTAEGNAIPDALTSTRSIEIKDTVCVSCTKQVRTQTDAAREAGRESVLITGSKTRVSGPARRAFDDIIRRDDLGPR